MMESPGEENLSVDVAVSGEGSSAQHEDIEEILKSFREVWKKELQRSRQPNESVSALKDVLKESTEDTEGVAKVLFLKGCEMERNGKLCEAIQFYRRAVQLVPDIEFRLDAKAKSKTKDPENSEDDTEDILKTNQNSDLDSDESDEDYEKEGTVLLHIQRKFNKNMGICAPAHEQKTTHISVLPMEIILYILRWVVSADLDLRSLEMCSRTCRGFYICCRDSEIWRLACSRSLGVNLLALPKGYLSWRNLFIDQTLVRFNGCYISKTTYIRHGENSFQDQFYSPWHIVTYYRYLRFFPEGLVLMLTTADDPSQCVSQLKYRTAKSPAVLSGYYRRTDDKLTIVVRRQEQSLKNSLMFKRNKRAEPDQNVYSQTFHLEMEIQNYKRLKNIQLSWTGYTVFTCNRDGTESKSTFDLVGNSFPPMWFSRVKSYTNESYSPLQ